jgi:hypothetical protein
VIVSQHHTNVAGRAARYVSIALGHATPSISPPFPGAAQLLLNSGSGDSRCLCDDQGQK